MKPNIIGIRFLFVLTVMTLSSCHPFSCKWQNGYEQLSQLPKQDSIIGIYELTSKSNDYLRNKGFNKKCQLTILDSSKYIIRNFPYFILDLSEKAEGKTVNLNGKWFTDCSESYGCIIELENIQVMPIARKNAGQISILMTIGDGDECNGIIFEKK